MSIGIKIPKNTFQAGRDKFAKGDDYGNVDLDPGKYICQVVKGRGVDTDKGPKIILDLLVAGESAQAGGKISIWYNLSEEYVIWLFRALSILGYDVTEMDEAMLEQILTDIEETKPVVRIKASRKDDNMNYRIEKLLTDITIADASSETSGSAADEDAGGGTAGIKEEAHGKAEAPPQPAAKTPAPKPVPAAKTVAPAKAPDPAPAQIEEVVAEEEVVEDETQPQPIKIGDTVPATLSSGKCMLTITAVHLEEGKVTGRSNTTGKLVKCGLDKLG